MSPDPEETPRAALDRARRALAVVQSAEQWAERNPQASADVAHAQAEKVITAAFEVCDAFGRLSPLLSFAPPARRGRRGGFFARVFAWLFGR